MGRGGQSENPNGILAQSPRLRGTSYLGDRSTRIFPTPTGLWLDARAGRNPVGVGVIFCGFPRVARASQPWAGGRNPFGIDRRPQPPRLRALALKSQQSRAHGVMGKALVVPERAKNHLAQRA